MFWCAKYFFTLLLVSVSSGLESPDGCCFRLWLNPSRTLVILVVEIWFSTQKVSQLRLHACCLFGLHVGRWWDASFHHFHHVPVSCIFQMYKDGEGPVKDGIVQRLPRSQHIWGLTPCLSIWICMNKDFESWLSSQHSTYCSRMASDWAGKGWKTHPVKPESCKKKNLKKRIIREHNRLLYFSEIYFKDDVRDEMSEA